MAARATVGPTKPELNFLSLHDQIRQRAYQIYLQRGERGHDQDGSSLEDWLQAEEEIRQAEAEGYLSRE